MNEPVAIVPITTEYQAQIEAWAGDDAGSALFKQSNSQLLIGQDSHSWVAVRNNEPVGAATITPNANGLNFMYVIVKPSERRRGIGARLVDAVLEDPYAKSLTRLHSLVDPAN